MTGSLDSDIECSKEDREAAGEPFASALFGILFLTLLLLFLAGPSGEFPLNDDWLYSLGVKSIVQSGVFRIPTSNAFDFIPIYFGSFVSFIFGFSHERLRWLTICFHLFGITGLFFALKELGLKRLDNLAITSVYALNPFLFNLSLSFMTDVPALAMNNWVLYSSLLAINRRKLSLFFLSISLSVAAMSIRQNSLILLPPVIFAAFAVFNLGKKFLAVLSFSIITTVAAFFALQKWLLNASTSGGTYQQFSHLLLDALKTWSLQSIIEMVAKSACYLGLFLIPVCVAIVFSFRFSRKNYLICGLISFFCCLLPLLIVQSHGTFMPYSQNLFLPPIIGSYCVMGGAPTWSTTNLRYFTYFCDFVALLFFFCMLLVFFKPRACQNDKTGNPICFATKFFLGSLVASIVAGLLIQLKASNFDRYYLIALGPFILALAYLWSAIANKRALIICIFLVALMGIYATLAAQDFMCFSRAQWHIISTLIKSGVSPEDIDGGPAYSLSRNADYFCGHFTQTGGWAEEFRGTEPLSKLRWWPVLGDKYVISTCNLPGFHAIKEEPFWSALRFHTRKMLVIQSDDSVEPRAN